MRLPRLDSSGLHVLVTAGLVAAASFWVAWDDGSYGIESRNALAIAAWWAVIVVVAFGLVPKTGLPREALRLGALLAALAVWTLVSLLWAPSAEKAFDEFDRVTLYLGVFALVGTTASRGSLDRWVSGFAAAVAAVSVVALASRLFPGLLPGRDLEAFLPAAATRLSFPVGYWNGLAILVAFGVPLLLSLAVTSRSAVPRALAVAPMPLIASVIYLASSRGGVLCAAVGVVAFLLLTERRWAAAAAASIGGIGSAAAIAVLLRRSELVDGPLGTELVEKQGRSAAALLLLVCVATGAAYGAGTHMLAGRGFAPPRVVGWLVVAVLLAVAIVAVRASDPVEQLRTFRAAPSELEEIERGDFVKQHLLSSRGSGRWQFWDAAVEQWRDSPLWGGGAGSYEAWWAKKGSISHFVKDAHSLYLETLGELGVVGFALVLAFVVFGVAGAALRARRASGDERVYAAALAAVFAAFAATAAIDWMWELTAVAVIAVAALALVVGPAARVPSGLVVAGSDAPPVLARRTFGAGVAVVLVAWLLVVAHAVPLLAQREIGASQAAAARGDFEAALDAAESARDIQPWAATPYLQLALVSERMAAFRHARGWIDDAIARDAEDWRLWLVAARVQTKLGRVSEAERSLRRAAQLNPRSPLFRGLEGSSG